MKITVEIDEFYLEGEDIEQSLKQFIINSCVQNIHKSIDKKINDQIERQVKLLLENALSKEITKKTKEFIETGRVTSRNNPSKTYSIEEYIQQDFDYNSGWNNHKDNIKNIAEKYGKELKQRCDLLFASQIVAKLSDNGLLREDAKKMLLETIDKK